MKTAKKLLAILLSLVMIMSCAEVSFAATEEEKESNATPASANSIGVGGIPGILSMQPQSMGSFAICMLIAIAVPFVLTVICGKKKMK